jgi:phosphate-selective porin OprO/OprP
VRDVVLKMCVAALLLALPGATGWSQETPQAPSEAPPATAEEGQVLDDEKLRDINEDAVLPEEEEEKREEQAAETAPPPEVDPTAYRIYWDRGFRVERNDKQFRLKIGGRFMWDSVWIDGDNDIEDAFGTGYRDEVRRAWTTLSGTYGSRVFYSVQFDMAGNSAGATGRNRYIRQAYVAITPPGRLNGIRLGFSKEPFGMDMNTGSVSLRFMERALPSVFAPNYNLGVLFDSIRAEGRVHWWIGAYRYSGDGGGRTRFDLTGRITAVPWTSDNDARMIHLGVSYSHQFRDEFDLRYRSRPETHLRDRWVDTGDFEAEGQDLAALELAGKWDSFIIQSELMGATARRTRAKTVRFWGAYAQASYFLTGEQRPYSQLRGAFSRIGVERPFDWKLRHPGAWEVAVRYSHLDLDDEDIRGGTLNDVTLGLNWYPRPHLRLMANYLLAHRNGIGDGYVYQLRFQIDY